MENSTQTQEQNKTNWFVKHKIIAGLSVVTLSVLFLSAFHHNSGDSVAVLGKQTVKSTTVSITASATLTPIPTLVPTNTPLPTMPPTQAPISTKVIYSSPTISFTYTLTVTPIAINNQTATQQTTQQCVGAMALCTDGTCSYSANHQGTCSHHGGVAQWYK